MTVTLVGEVNPYGADPKFALYHLPEYASGNRLRRILGLRAYTYEALDRRNLCTGRWSLTDARLAAEEILKTSCPTVVILGRKAASAFRFKGEFFSAEARGAVNLISLPHPSGLNPIWNDHAKWAVARDLVIRYAPDIPWGESTE